MKCIFPDDPAVSATPRRCAASRPTWLKETCPAWCTEVHAHQPFVDDRRHAALLPTVVNLSLHDEHQGSGDTWLPETLMFWLTKRVGGEATRIEIGNESWPEEIRLTPAEARQAAQQLNALADLAEAVDR